MSGELTVLNVGAGDIAITFNQHDPAERAKAIAMLTDMQQRGYAILILLEDGTYARATSIDAKRGRYLIQVPEDVPVEAVGPEAEEEPQKKKRGRPKKVSVPIERTRAVGVARSAGG